jgi:hypothetical protein
MLESQPKAMRKSINSVFQSPKLPPHGGIFCLRIKGYDMNEAWAAITAGVIAAAAGGIGLVMTKENKTSEFRQTWIQELRLALPHLVRFF